MPCDHECSVAVPHGDVGWSAVSDCGIHICPDHTHLLFLIYGIHCIETELYRILDGMTLVILYSEDPSLGINTQ